MKLTNVVKYVEQESSTLEDLQVEKQELRKLEINSILHITIKELSEKKALFGYKQLLVTGVYKLLISKMLNN
ncbi:hypothetical protein GCM10008085_16600 [Winogradskyella epiphytica]|nr:hypothetical protein GCM10008085_16600 [Winogradskyella epiphytica]